MILGNQYKRKPYFKQVVRKLFWTLAAKLAERSLELPTSVRLIGLFMRTSFIASEVLLAAKPEINEKRCCIVAQGRDTRKPGINIDQNPDDLLFSSGECGEFSSCMVLQLP